MKSSVTGIRFGVWRKFVLLGFALIAGMALYAEVACSFEGATMNVVAPSTHAGGRLVLLWDATDKGDDPSAWANASEIATAVPAAGARYVVDLGALGITKTGHYSTEKLTDVYYAGTTEQWKQLYNAENGHQNTLAGITVHCADGDVIN